MGKIRIILGISLLIVGVFVIGYPMFVSWQIVEGKREIPYFFKEEVKEEGYKNGTINNLNNNLNEISPSEIEGKMQNIVERELSKLLPVKDITQLLNLIAWSIIAAIFIFGGGQIAQLGIKLFRV